MRHSAAIRHLRGMRLLPLLLLACASPAVVRGQDISEYEINGGKGIFQREMVHAFVEAPPLHLPVFDCAVEYIRRFEGKDITYRRGPISMHAVGREDLLHLSPNTDELTIPDDGSGKHIFVGGMLVDLPRAGETVGYLPMADAVSRYMLRVSIEPLVYRNATLTASVLIERAMVIPDEQTLTVQQSEVFTRTVDIRGNEPLHFSLPAWEAVVENAGDVVPSSLSEALLITLETPRYFGFTRNYPEPFASTTHLTYAVPTACTVEVSVDVAGTKTVIDEGHREAGVYHVNWSAKNLPDGVYNATLTATDSTGAVLHTGILRLTKDRNASSYMPPRPVSTGLFNGRVTLSTESGLAYQLPSDKKKALRNMFTHVAVRAGYRVTQHLEIGLMGGQDSFHEYPGPQVDIDRISDYGGVVPYTYGYIGPYARLAFSTGIVQPLIQGAVVFTSHSPVAEFGAGARLELFSRIQIFAVPSIMAHLKSSVSTKIGIHYGVGVRL